MTSHRPIIDLAYKYRDVMRELELQECRKAFYRILGQHDTTYKDRMFLEQIQGSQMEEPYTQELLAIANKRLTAKELKRRKIRYYLYAGAPVLAIQGLLHTTQKTIYDIRNYEFSTHSNLTEILNANPSIAHNLDRMLNDLNVLDGYRIP